MLVHLQKSSKTKLSNVKDNDYQPNAVDLRINKVFKLYSDSNPFILRDNNDNLHLRREEILPDAEKMFNLSPGEYEISYEHEISVGKEEAGYIIARSTLNRNGLMITSGLYDAGYSGNMSSCLHVSHFSRIEKGSRVAQLLLIKSEVIGEYDGNYGKKSKKNLDSHLK